MREQLDIEIERLREADRKVGRRRSFAALCNEAMHLEGDAACPELAPDLLYVEAMHGRMGTDANGRATLAEMREWWAREGVHDPGEQEAFEQLWRAIESETSRYLWEQRKSLTTKSED